MRPFRITDMAFKREPEYIEIIFAKWEELGLELKEYFESVDNDIDWTSQESIISYEGFENGFHTIWLTRHDWSEKGESPGFGSNNGSEYPGIGGSPTQRIR